MTKKRKVLKWFVVILFFSSVFAGSLVPQTASAQNYDNASPDFLFPIWKPTHKPLRINQPSDKQSVITGYATPCWGVTAVVNGNIFSSKADRWGNVRIDLGRTFPGGSEVIVYQFDPQGNIVDTINTTMTGVVPINLKAPEVRPVYTNDTTVSVFSNAPGVRVVINGQTFYGSTELGVGTFVVQLGRTYPAGTRVDVYGERNGQLSPVSTVFVQPRDIYVEPPKLNSVTTRDTVITGTSNESLVEVQIGNNTYRAYPDSNTKKFSVNLGHTLAVGTKVTAYGVKEGKRSSGTSIYVEQGITVEPPVLNPVNTTDNFLSGWSSAPLVEVELQHATMQLHPDPNTGKFSVQLWALTAGTKIAARAIKDGERSSDTVIYAEQGIVVTPPKLNSLSSTEKILTGESDADKVIVTFGGNQSYTAKPDPTTHKFSIQLDKTYAAGTLVSAYGVKGGVESSTTNMYVTQGTIQLKAPILNTVSTQDTVVSGTADPNTTIKLNISTDSYEAKTDGQGNFKVLLDHAYPVDSLISVYSTDGQHKSPITSGKVIQGSFKLGVNMITDTDRILTGMALPNSKIKVQVGNRIYEGEASAFGTFMIQMSQTYKAGQNIEITATDPNSGRAESKVVIVYPGSPSVNTILPGTSAVSGQVSPNAFVVVQIGGQNYSGIANAAGYFFVAINPNDAVVGAEATVTQISNNIESLPTRIIIGS